MERLSRWGGWFTSQYLYPLWWGAGDRLIDDLGRMFVVNGAEQSDIGWRINAIEMHP